jgi:methylmalonyl-CoA mutase N-terminal domain/subunit
MFDEDEMAKIEKIKKSWENKELKETLEIVGERKKKFITESGITVKRLYTPLDLKEEKWSYNEKLSFPGLFPFTRGDNPTVYRSNFWKVYQYGGYGTAETTNIRFKYTLQQGANELGVALDLPTQIGYDSDHPLAKGEVGRIGVAIDSFADMEAMFDGIPLEKIDISTTANAIGPIFLAWCLALAEKRGLPFGNLRVRIQNDILKEYVARGTYIFPIKPSVRFACDLIEYGLKNKISNLRTEVCGYHIREAGATVVQEMAFTIANAIEYLKELMSRGISINDLPQPIMNTVAGLELFEGVSKNRAMRRMWARILKDRFGAKETSECLKLAFFSGCQASRWTAQQPLNNIIRGTIAALVQALSGAQVCGVARYDQALCLPTPESVRIAARTQQIVAEETGVTDTVDPLGGSYYVEALTDELEDKALELLKKVEEMGGAIAAIENGFMEAEIGKSAYKDLREVESGERARIGVNKYQVEEPISIEIMKVDITEEEKQIEKLKRLKKERDNDRVNHDLQAIEEAAQDKVNLVPPILNAVKSYATIGEICGVLREIFGDYQRPRY